MVSAIASMARWSCRRGVASRSAPHPSRCWAIEGLVHPAHWAWAISILVAALAFAIAYVRTSVTLARIFLREARRRRAASGEVGPASRESLPR